MIRIKIPVVVMLAVIILLTISCSGSPPATGVLQGRVSIGPLSPVVQQGQTDEVPCEVYRARKILVYKQNGTSLVETLDIDCEGTYRAELDSGKYVIDINHAGIDHSSEVPAEIEISANTTTYLDINIDTGIR